MQTVAELFIIDSPMEFGQSIPFTTRSLLKSQITLLKLEIYYSLIH